MSKTAVIGVTGKKRSGKDEVYKSLARNGLDGVIRVAFADAVKTELAKACEVTVPFIEEHKEQFRGGLQWWGTEFRRHFKGNDYWVNEAVAQYYKIVKHYSPRIVVFTDVRFPNECEAIRRLGGKVWRVTRPGEDARDQHASETALDAYPVDRVIDNDKCLLHLRAEVMRGVLMDFGPEALCITH